MLLFSFFLYLKRVLYARDCSCIYMHQYPSSFDLPERKALGEPGNEANAQAHAYFDYYIYMYLIFKEICAKIDTFKQWLLHRNIVPMLSTLRMKSLNDL